MTVAVFLGALLAAMALGIPIAYALLACGVNDLGGTGTVEGNAIKALMQSFFQSTRETPALLTNKPSADQLR